MAESDAMVKSNADDNSTSPPVGTAEAEVDDVDEAFLSPKAKPTNVFAHLITSSSEGEETTAIANDDGDGADCDANITPHPPAKRVRRVSPRLEAARREKEDKGTKKAKNKKGDTCEDDDDVTSAQYEASNADAEDRNHTNVYFEVDDILDRRTRRYGSESAGLRHVVEYLVSWKVPADYSGDASYYEPSWLIAENLDQNSLASAFRKFPMDGDPDRESVRMQQVEMDAKEVAVDECLDLDFSDDEEMDMEEESEDEDDETTTDVMQEYDVQEQNDKSTNLVKDPDVSCLEESDYDSPGTVELVLNRKTYRVGQSFFSGPDKKILYTIAMIQPTPRKATCYKYMRIEECFVCPEGYEGSYVLLSDKITLELSLLKIPCPMAFKKFPMKYSQEDESQRSFSYFNDKGKILHHPFERPTVLDLFSGAGGMSLGMLNYFDVKWAVDNNHLAAATFTANKKDDVQVYTEDVKTFLRRCVQGNPCYPSAGEVDHIHASPPCKGFSRANRSGGKDDLRNNKQTLLVVMAVKHFKPKTISFENVPGLVLDDFKGYLQFLVSCLLKMKYQLRVQVLSSSSYGDPQKRRRLILLAARSDCMLPTMPLPTHGPGLLPVKTSGDALRLLEKHAPSSHSSGTVLVGGQVVFNHITSSSNRQKREEDFELCEDEPSRTIMATSRPHRHYHGGRYISVREAACLQSFPLSYRFFGSLSSQYSQVGNAVPVKLATAISRSVATAHGV